MSPSQSEAAKEPLQYFLQVFQIKWNELLSNASLKQQTSNNQSIRTNSNNSLKRWAIILRQAIPYPLHALSHTQKRRMSNQQIFVLR